METLKISGTTYQVIERKATAEYDEQCPNLAQFMRSNGVQYSMILKRPQGQKCFLAYQYTGGDVKILVSA